MTQPSDTIKTWATDVGVRPAVAGASNVQAALSAAASGGWVPFVIPTDQGSWDVANATGTWTFVGGTIAQTDATQTDAAIWTNADTFALNMVVELEGRVDTVDGGGQGGWGLLAGCDPLNPLGVTPDFVDHCALWGVGQPQTLPAGGDISFGVCPPGIGTSVSNFVPFTVGAFRTLRFQQPAFLTDGGVRAPAMTSLLAISSYNYVDVTDPPASRFALIADGAVTLRNFKVWRIPLPTLT